MVSSAKLLRITQGFGEKYKNIGLEKFQTLILYFFKYYFFEYGHERALCTGAQGSQREEKSRI
jgi:hypothetical protein